MLKNYSNLLKQYILYIWNNCVLKLSTYLQFSLVINKYNVISQKKNKYMSINKKNLHLRSVWIQIESML